jgi:putative transposase
MRIPEYIRATRLSVYLRGLLGFIPSDNGPEFTAKAVRYWLKRLGLQTLFRDQLLNGETLTSLLEAQILIENWRKEYTKSTA